MSRTNSVVLRDLTFAWPDGSAVLAGVSGSFTRGRTGLVGANGTGKSTLLRLIAGDLEPSAGTITVEGTVDHLPQRITAGPGTRVEDLLGISAARRALAAISAGSLDPVDLETVGDDWDVEDRAVGALAALELPVDLDRPVTALSGGEAMLTAIVGVRLRGADVALLDEPTNNLDRAARERVHELIRTWPATVVVVSHDLELLDLLDQTAELRAGSLSTFGGPYGAYRAWLDAEQDAARQALRSAEQEVRRQKHERARTEVRIAHSERQGRKDRENRKYVAAVVDKRRNAAEKSQGARRGRADARVESAQKALRAAEAAVRTDAAPRIDLPDPRVPAGRRLVVLPSSDGRDLVLQGPERVALVGPNGVGKTSLLRAALPHASGRVGYLAQRIELDDEATVLDVVRAGSPGLAPGEVRNRLARLLVRGAMVDHAVGSLSGGERFRVALARLVLADPPPEVLVLDEPTNDLDVASVDELVAALAAYRGALLVVSHDQRFLDRLDLDRVVRLDRAGVLRE